MSGITYSKDKHGDGYLLRGLESELVENELVEVTLKSGATKSERVGKRRAGPFADGMVLHEKASGGTKAKAAQLCPHCGGNVNERPAKTAPISTADEGLPF